MKVEGLMEDAWVYASTQNKPLVDQMSEANAKRLRELLAAEQERKTG
jgi:hypothetical protein